MTPCTNCGKPLVCSCAKTQKAGYVIETCKKKNAAIWVLVMDHHGKGVEGVTVFNGEKRIPTSSQGVVRFEDQVKSSYTITVGPVMDKDKDLYDLPEVPSQAVTPTPGAITQVLFTLRPKAKLKVELIPDGSFPLPPAQVVLERIVSKTYSQSKYNYVTEEKAKKSHGGGTADFATQPCDDYRIRVIIDKKDEKEYGANDAEVTLEPGDDKLVKIKILRYFKTVRFVGLCLTTIGRQVWTGSNDLVVGFERAKAAGGVIVPDASDAKAYTKYLFDYWGSSAEDQKNGWKAKYNGPQSDVADITARVDFLQKNITKASATLTDDTELKVFVAPECFFLGRYGAYPHEIFGSLIEKLQELVKDPKWKAWVFVFGTVNGTYSLEDRSEIFNISPVIKGGWDGEDPGKYTRLLQKSYFSAEIIAKDDLIPPAKSELDRAQLTEEAVGKSFHPTETEQHLGEQIKDLLNEIKEKKTVTQVADWLPKRLEDMRVETEKAISDKGLRDFVREIRPLKPDPARRPPSATPDDWKKDLRFLLSLYMEPELEQRVVRPQKESFNFNDYCFSCLRLPGPWLDDVVQGEDTSQRHTKLTFAVEVCADHNNGRVSSSMGSIAAHERPDIHLVPSAGMVLNTGFVFVVDKGFAFNCDGWNAPPNFGVSHAERGAKIVFDENDLAPRKSGNNPLLPHTELWQRDGTAFKSIKDPVATMDPDGDASQIFSCLSEEERKKIPAQKAALADSMVEAEKLECQTAIQDAQKTIDQKQKDLAKVQLEIDQKNTAIQLKEQEILKSQSTPTSPPSTTPTPQPGMSLSPQKQLEQLKRNLAPVLLRKQKIEKEIEAAKELQTKSQELFEKLEKQPKTPITAPVPKAQAGQIHIYPSKDLPTTY